MKAVKCVCGHSHREHVRDSFGRCLACTCSKFVPDRRSPKGSTRRPSALRDEGEYKDRIERLEGALTDAQIVAGRFMRRGHAGFEYEEISQELALTLQELSLIHRSTRAALKGRSEAMDDDGACTCHEPDCSFCKNGGSF